MENDNIYLKKETESSKNQLKDKN